MTAVRYSESVVDAEFGSLARRELTTRPKLSHFGRLIDSASTCEQPAVN